MTEENIKEIDNELTDLVVDLKSLSKDIAFKEICEFKIGDESFDIPYHDMNFQGIYVFEIKNQDKHENFKDWLQ